MRLVPSLLAVAVVTATTAFAAAADAPAKIRDVTVEPGIRLDVERVRTTLGEELAAVAPAAAGSAPRRTVFLNVAVAKHTVGQNGTEMIVTAVVSDAHAGVLVGVLRGRAWVDGARPLSSWIDDAMLHTAAHGALENLPTVLH
jgi:hypothetical protein